MKFDTLRPYIQQSGTITQYLASDDEISSVEKEKSPQILPKKLEHLEEIEQFYEGFSPKGIFGYE